MKTIALFNQKGGVGKTTSAANIGAGLARLGRRVLLIDLDPQANLTYSLGLDPFSLDASIYELLDGKAALADTIRTRDGFDLIPAAIQLAGAELHFAGVPGREMLLRDVLQETAGYDYALIDCPPSLGLLTLNALTACQTVYIPIQAELLPLQGLRQLMDTVELVRKRLNPGIKITGVITTFYDPRKIMQRTVLERIGEQFGGKVFKSPIRVNVALAEAPGQGQTIFEYSPDSNGAADYTALCQEILTREGGQNG